MRSANLSNPLNSPPPRFSAILEERWRMFSLAHSPRRAGHRQTFGRPRALARFGQKANKLYVFGILSLPTALTGGRYHIGDGASMEECYNPYLFWWVVELSASFSLCGALDAACFADVSVLHHVPIFFLRWDCVEVAAKLFQTPVSFIVAEHDPSFIIESSKSCQIIRMYTPSCRDVDDLRIITARQDGIDDWIDDMRESI